MFFGLCLNRILFYISAKYATLIVIHKICNPIVIQKLLSPKDYAYQFLTVKYKRRLSRSALLN